MIDYNDFKLQTISTPAQVNEHYLNKKPLQFVRAKPNLKQVVLVTIFKVKHYITMKDLVYMESLQSIYKTSENPNKTKKKIRK